MIRLLSSVSTVRVHACSALNIAAEASRQSLYQRAYLYPMTGRRRWEIWLVTASQRLGLAPAKMSMKDMAMFTRSSLYDR